MSRDLTDAYARAQAFKEHWNHLGAHDIPPERLEELRVAVEGKLSREGITDAARAAALYNTLRGVAWIAGLASTYDLAIDPLMTVPEDIARNVTANMEGIPLAPKQCVELGIGAGFFTGLLIGLDIQGTPSTESTRDAFGDRGSDYS